MSYIKAFLETEVEEYSTSMETYLTKHYNNALYNGIPWMVLILHIIHYLFDVLVNAFLKKMRFKEYIRIRLKRSLWYLGFYVCSFLYCSATAWKNNIRFPHEVKFIMLDFSEPIAGHIFAGYALLSAFYASSFVWEGLQCSYHLFTYLFLVGFCAFTYYLHYIELLIILTCTISSAEIISELVRCIYCTMRLNGSCRKIMMNMFYIYLVTISAVFVFIIPVYFALPLLKGLQYNSSSITIIGLNVTLLGWYISAIYTTPLFRLILHHWRHKKNEDPKVPDCVGSIVECALFPPRDDLAYNLRIIKQEIKERQDRVNALRRPKKRANVFFQTLKCMVALNRKIKDRKEKKSLLKEVQVDGHQFDSKELNDVQQVPGTTQEISTDKSPCAEENHTSESTSYSINDSEDEDSSFFNDLEMIERYPVEDSVAVEY